MLVSFEGLDGSGKTSLLTAVEARLTDLVGPPIIGLSEFSDADSGQRLVAALGDDKFLAPRPGVSVVLTRTLEIIADLFYFDEAEIAPAEQAGSLVLKDRHLDTVLSCQGAMLERDAGWSRPAALGWLDDLLRALQVRPHLTVLVNAPATSREGRIAARSRSLVEARATKVSDEDRAIFALREQWYEMLRGRDSSRWLLVQNLDGGLVSAVDQVVTEIRRRLELRES